MTHSLTGIDEILFQMSNQLFDLRVVVHILNSQQQPVIFVGAGKVHTDHISQMLQELGYSSKVIKEEELDRAAAIKNSENAHDLFNLNWDNAIKLNVKEFIDSCATIKMNPQAILA